jgi:hypothetical protein
MVRCTALSKTLTAVPACPSSVKNGQAVDLRGQIIVPCRPAIRGEVVYHPIDLLRPDPRDARQHSRKQIGQIADSIRAFGFNALPTGKITGNIAKSGPIAAVWQGSTLCAAIYKNRVRTLAIDNWTQFSGPYDKFSSLSG